MVNRGRGNSNYNQGSNRNSGGNNGRGGSGRGRGNQNQSRRNGQQQPQRNNEGSTSMLTLSFLQMYRLPSVSQTTQELRARTHEFGVVPCSSKEIAANALRSLGAGTVLRPKIKITLLNVESSPVVLTNSNSGPTPGAAMSGPGVPQFTIMGTSNGLQPGLTTSRPPPEGTIGVVKRTTGYKWVVASIGDRGQSNLSWVPTTDESYISVAELVKMDLTFDGVIAVIDNNTHQQTFVSAGIAVAQSLRSAMGGNVAAIVACAKMLGNGVCAPLPVNSLNGDRPTPDAIVAFISWLGAAADQIPVGATVGVTSIKFE
jgi:hypothetical protein